MDLETADAIGTLGDEVRRVEATLAAEVRRVETTLGAEVRRVETTLGAEVRRVETMLREEVRRVETILRDEFRTGLADSRRHAEVLTESLRDDIRIVAEGLAVVGAKLDGLR